jgi:hypothetical protein
MGTSLKKEKTDSGSCARGEPSGTTDCGDSIGEFCSVTIVVSNHIDQSILAHAHLLGIGATALT